MKQIAIFTALALLLIGTHAHSAPLTLAAKLANHLQLDCHRILGRDQVRKQADMNSLYNLLRKKDNTEEKVLDRFKSLLGKEFAGSDLEKLLTMNPDDFLKLSSDEKMSFNESINRLMAYEESHRLPPLVSSKLTTKSSKLLRKKMQKYITQTELFRPHSFQDFFIKSDLPKAHKTIAKRQWGQYLLRRIYGHEAYATEGGALEVDIVKADEMLNFVINFGRTKSFSPPNLSQMDLRQVSLKGNFSHADFTGSDLRDALVQTAPLDKVTSLEGAKLADAKLLHGAGTTRFYEQNIDFSQTKFYRLDITANEGEARWAYFARGEEITADIAKMLNARKELRSLLNMDD